MNKIKTDFYKKYIGSYAKRFYSPFKLENIAEIVGFKLKQGFAHIEVKQGKDTWWWDAEDSIIIVNEPLGEEVDRVANVNDDRYLDSMHNPFK